MKKTIIKKTIMKKTIRDAVRVILIGYLLLLSVLILPPFFGIRVNAVISGSMEPNIRTGSVVYISEAPFEEIREGDVITFRLKESNVQVTHRVVGRNDKKRFFMTKGDANEQPDGPVTPYENVQGKVRFSIPYLGRLAVFLMEDRGKLALGGLLILLTGMEAVFS